MAIIISLCSIVERELECAAIKYKYFLGIALGCTESDSPFHWVSL